MVTPTVKRIAELDREYQLGLCIDEFTDLMVHLGANPELSDRQVVEYVNNRRNSSPVGRPR